MIYYFVSEHLIHGINIHNLQSIFEVVLNNGILYSVKWDFFSHERVFSVTSHYLIALVKIAQLNSKVL